jgi:hypothetical protein
MFEKRALLFVALVTLVWAVSISSLAAYFYLENTAYAEQTASTRQTLDRMTLAYDELISKYNMLQREYSPLYGCYSFPLGVNFTQLMKPLGSLIGKLEENYSSILIGQEDLNKAYSTLQEGYQEVYEKGSSITREDFGGLLSEFYELLNLLTLRELSAAVSETVTLTVSICIDYGNGTIEWHNETVPAGISLFQLTRKVADINEDDYDYYPLMKPGHVFLNSINDREAYSAPDFSEGWTWIWYYWDDDEQDWTLGIVGCDAWMVENGGTYKWNFEHWSYP